MRPVRHPSRGRRLWTAAACLLTLAFCGAARAQQELEVNASLLQEHMQEQIGGRKQEMARARNEIISMWFRYRHHVELGDMERADAVLEEIRSYSRKMLVDESHRLGMAFLYQGYQFHEIHQDERAMDALNKALSFAPYLYPAHEGKAKVFFRRNPYNPFPWLAEGLSSLGARFDSFWSAYNATCNSASVAFIAIGVFGLGLALTGALRSFRLLFHEMMERWRRLLPYDLALLLGGGVLFLPSFLWLGPLWYIPLWAMLFWAYLNFMERFGLLLFLAWMACLVPALTFGKQLTLIPGDPYVRAAVAAATGEFDEARVNYLEEMLVKNPGNTYLCFVLGTLYQNGGFMDEARRYYQKAIETKPNFHEAYINLGNISFNLQEPYDAIRLYKKSIEIQPSALAWHNMSKAYTLVFDFPNASDAMGKANALDPALTAEYATVREGVPDAKIKMEDLRRQFFQVSRGGLGEAAASAVSGRTFLNPLSFLSLGTLAGIVLYSFLTRKSARARACIKCGRTFCDRCRAGLETETFCSQCGHLFIKKDGVSPSVRNRKLYEAARHERRRRAVYHALNVVLPGSGQIFIGNAIYGSLALAVWALGAATVVSQQWTLSDTFAIVTSFNVVSGYLGWAILAAAWILGNPLAWAFGQHQE